MTANPIRTMVLLLMNGDSVTVNIYETMDNGFFWSSDSGRYKSGFYDTSNEAANAAIDNIFSP